MAENPKKSFSVKKLVKKQGPKRVASASSEAVIKRKKSSEDMTREIAFFLLSEVLDKKRNLADLFEKLPKAEARDRAAGHRLAAATLRRVATADCLAGLFLKRQPPERVRHILRLGITQIMFLDTPVYAAVDTSVELARSQKSEPFCPLINAVLHKISRAGKEVLEDYHIPRLEMPEWLWQSLGDKAPQIAAALADEALLTGGAPLDISVKDEGFVPEGGLEIAPGSYRFPRGTLPTEIEGFAEGKFWVQDLAASLAVRLAGEVKGLSVADLCAAPGGKTAQLAAAGAKVLAVDVHEKRLQTLKSNFARLNLPVETKLADILTDLPSEKFDIVLLDAPCSATGTARRHPEIMHLRRPADLPEVIKKQQALLRASVKSVKPGGKLIYAVCSLLKEEGEEQAFKALQELPLRLLPVRAEELPFLPGAVTSEGFVRTDPAMMATTGGLDGFFIARFEVF